MAKRFKKTMIKKIVITGPESCGKTTLAKSLGEIYKCHVVKEFARDYLNKLNRKYKYDDLLKIAKGQEKEEVKINALEKKILICDTSIHTIKIWSHDKFNKCHPKVYDLEENYRHYFLCSPDIPWEYDPLRENPKDRDRIFNAYIKELKNKSLTIVKGSIKERVKQVQKIIDLYL